MSGFVIQLIHMYAQFGCLARAWIIQLSDHAVDPSFGRIASTGGEALSACTNWVVISHVVPSTVLPLRERALFLRVVAPVLADDALLLLHQVDDRLELRVVERVRDR